MSRRAPRGRLISRGLASPTRPTASPSRSFCLHLARYSAALVLERSMCSAAAFGVANADMETSGCSGTAHGSLRNLFNQPSVGTYSTSRAARWSSPTHAAFDASHLGDVRASGWEEPALGGRSAWTRRPGTHAPCLCPRDARRRNGPLVRGVRRPRTALYGRG
jgi:hypothetical protein